jgi:diguanylate cyclase (GGDEF)-like protein
MAMTAMTSEQQYASSPIPASAAGNGCTGAALAAAILDSLTINVAVVDSTGTVVAANAEWRRFAGENQCGDHACYLGSNYFAVCERAVRHDGDLTAELALKGIRAVLSHEQESFTLEYPCHSPTERRWFRLRVTLLSVPGLTGCVLAHENITLEKLAEEALRETERRLRESLERERVLARTDGLTGLVNRRHFAELAERDVAIALRYGLPLALVFFDIDGFKSINDALGHAAGDEVLQEVARRAGRQLRSADVLARYGGEEFIVLVPESTAQSAAVVAERIREGIAEEGIGTSAGTATVTISAGISEIQSHSDTLAELLRRADQALYDAKAGGRNRTVVHG